ncbi:MAG: AmmeMemoRadiSam system protein B [Balneolaceae bacterium]|nr:AmmeMemoRadiSam system protein B [Balneolaceae bacterium]MCH8550056.1 AmmeMemoRadiSam system protein B [Balneolaceae bacterium]
MNISKYSREEVLKGLSKAKKEHSTTEETVRILFSPINIDSDNFEDVCRLYSRVGKNDFDTVVIVETHEGDAEKKLPMVSHKEFSTPLGTVEANDRLRNDFCDEDDDFFVDDVAFDESVSLYDQLMMLQCTMDDFSVLSIQITDENSFIIKELAYALEEILASKNALIVFCCDMDPKYSEEFEQIRELNEEGNLTGLMNHLNSGASSINGAGALFSGLIVAKEWGLKLNFLKGNDSKGSSKNLLAGYAEMQKQPIFG